MNPLDPLCLKAVLKALVLPPTGLLVLSALGLAVSIRFPRIGRAAASAGVALLLAVSLPVVAGYLTDLVDTSVPLDLGKASEAKAIVILGSGIRRDAPEYGGDTLGVRTLERVRYGARVARLTGLPVLVSGGTVLAGTPEATLMRAALESEFGVDVRWAEARSRTTHENAVRTAELLREEGIRRIVLVAHGVDMRRARAEFAAQGIEAVPAPTGQSGRTRFTVLDFLPSMAGLEGSYLAIYEIVANLVRVAGGQRW